MTQIPKSVAAHIRALQAQLAAAAPPQGAVPATTIADSIVALLSALTEDDIARMSPVQRQRFAYLCRHWGIEAGRPPPPRSGVLTRLQRGDRGH
jgi:hypothetical protein